MSGHSVFDRFSHSEDGAYIASERELEAEIHRIIHHDLEPMDAKVILGLYFGECTETEAAARLGLSRGEFRGRHERAKQNILKHVTRRFGRI
jgi:DNA-directed RNA polymerase specialized sigma subunit